MGQGNLFSRADEEGLLAEADFYNEESIQQSLQGRPGGGETNRLKGNNAYGPYVSTNRPARTKAPKRIQITSRESYLEILKTLAKREELVLHGLRVFINSRKRTPTAYELYEHLRVTLIPRGGIFDINNVRPTLTHLKDKGMVEFAPRRACDITKRTAYTWDFTESHREFLPDYWPAQKPLL